MFSIIVPLYNKEYSIKNCLSSIFEQDVEAQYEVILVDDGSTDNSKDVAFSCFQQQVDVGLLKVISQENAGVSMARNVGAKAAKFDFLCFLDADDEWICNFLSSIYDMIVEYPDAVAYGTGHFVSRNEEEPVKKETGYSENFIGYVENFFISSTKGSVLNSSKVCVRKAIFEECGGFPENAVVGEDLFLWVQIALRGRIAFCAEPLVVVNVVSDASRFKRRNKVPYPLEFYSRNRVPDRSGLSAYLFMIFYKHFASSLLGFRLRESFNIFRAYLKLRLL